MEYKWPVLCLNSDNDDGGSVTRCWKENSPKFFQKYSKKYPQQFLLKKRRCSKWPKSRQTFVLLINENLLPKTFKNAQSGHTVQRRWRHWQRKWCRLQLQEEYLQRLEEGNRSLSSELKLSHSCESQWDGLIIIEIEIFTHREIEHGRVQALDKIKPAFIYFRFKISWIRKTVFENRNIFCLFLKCPSLA